MATPSRNYNRPLTARLERFSQTDGARLLLEPTRASTHLVDGCIHLGDVLIEGDDILGDRVNIAARLEALAEPGGICLSDDAFRQVAGKIEAQFSPGRSGPLSMDGFGWAFPR
jgi:class 3 adenylate cyclase